MGLPVAAARTDRHLLLTMRDSRMTLFFRQIPVHPGVRRADVD